MPLQRPFSPHVLAVLCFTASSVFAQPAARSTPQRQPLQNGKAHARQSFQKVTNPNDSTIITGGTFIPIAPAGDICYAYKIGEVGSWPETRWVDDTCCPFGVCFHCPRCEVHDCTKGFYAQICGPDPGATMGSAVDECAKVAAAIGLATTLCCGPEAGAAAFLESFRSCLTIKGIDWGNKVKVRVYEQKDCGSWRNCT